MNTLIKYTVHGQQREVIVFIDKKNPTEAELKEAIIRVDTTTMTSLITRVRAFVTEVEVPHSRVGLNTESMTLHRYQYGSPKIILAVAGVEYEIPLIRR